MNILRRVCVPKIEERTGSYQCVYCHGLWDGPETWLDPFELERLCCGEPECRAAVERVSALPLSDYLATPEGAKKIEEWVRRDEIDFETC
jgi:hypothetical protein